MLNFLKRHGLRNELHPYFSALLEHALRVGRRTRVNVDLNVGRLREQLLDGGHEPTQEQGRVIQVDEYEPVRHVLADCAPNSIDCRLFEEGFITTEAQAFFKEWHQVGAAHQQTLGAIANPLGWLLGLSHPVGCSLNFSHIPMHLVDGYLRRFPQRRVARLLKRRLGLLLRFLLWRHNIVAASYASWCSGRRSGGGAKGLGWHNENKGETCVVVTEVDWPTKLPREDKRNNQVDVRLLDSLQDSNQLLLKTKFFDALALLVRKFVAVALDLDLQVAAVESATRHYIDAVADRTCYCRRKQVENHLSEHEVACANRPRRALVYSRAQREVALSEVVFSYALHLLEDFGHFEVGGGLGEGALGDVVDLLVVEDAVQDALGLVEGLLGDLLALRVQVTVQFL